MPLCRLKYAISTLLLASFTVFGVGCDSDDPDDDAGSILIGANLEISGPQPHVGRQSRQAIEMFVEETNAEGGLTVGAAERLLELVVSDNQGTADGAVSSANQLISGEAVMAMIGPSVSSAAVPAGAVANALETAMISPASTNPNTTLSRPWVFRAPFIDTFQGPVLANFATSQFSATEACMMYDPNDDYPLGLALSFRDAWIDLHGAASIAADEIFSPADDDFSEQLGRIVGSTCDFLFLPNYAHDVSRIVNQAHALGIDIPVLGSDTWASPVLLDECGSNCVGYYFSTHFLADGATGEARAFIDRYEARFGEEATSIAALTWDAVSIVAKAVQDCGTIAGNLEEDRSCVRDAMASIEDFAGVTGNISFDSNGDPVKCAVMAEVQDGDFSSVGSACP